MYRIEELKTDLEHEVRRSKMYLDDWTEKFADDPCYSLEWSRETFETAARLRVFGQAISYLEKTDDADPASVVLGMATKEALRGASSVPHSSSAQSNLLEAEKTAAWARLRERVEGFIEYAKEEDERNRNRGN